MATGTSGSFIHCRECEGKTLQPARDRVTWGGATRNGRESAELAIACFLQHPGTAGFRATLEMEGDAYTVKDAKGARPEPGGARDLETQARLQAEEALRRHGLAAVRDPERINLTFIGGDLAQRAAIRRALDEGLWDFGATFDLEIDVGLWDDGATPVMVVSATRTPPDPPGDARKDVSEVLAKRGFRTASMP